MRPSLLGYNTSYGLILNNCKSVPTAKFSATTTVHCATVFYKTSVGGVCRKNGNAQSASRGKAKSDVGGNEVSLEAAFGSRTKAANFQHVSSLRYGFQKTLQGHCVY